MSLGRLSWRSNYVGFSVGIPFMNHKNRLIFNEEEGSSTNRGFTEANSEPEYKMKALELTRSLELS